MKFKTKLPKIAQLHEELQLTRLAEMGRMASSVAHELNNPLMIVQGFAENIEMMLDNPETPPQELRLQVMEIIKACQRMSRIISKMNRMSPDQKLRLHVVDLAEVALNAVDFLKRQMSAIDVQLEFDFHHPVPVECDVVQVEQMVLNILTNAIKALESRPTERRLRISFEAIGNQYQQIKLWNNGPAVPDSVRAKLESGEATTGLGLCVARAVMEAHGGDLSFFSTEEMGTEFVLSFPSPKLNPWQQRERSTLGPMYIIDSHGNYRKTLAEKFRLLGFQTKPFADFVEGFDQILKSAPPCGVLVDIIPGQAEAEAFIRKLRHQLGPKALIFTMSHYTSARDFRTDLKAVGANECFEKPLHADNFALILKLLDAPRSA